MCPISADIAEAIGQLRVGTGFDVHPFIEGRPLILGGVAIPSDRGLEGHSDADVIAHAVTDAVLGTTGLGDIGTLFPSDDPRLKNADSMELLREAVAQVVAAGTTLISVDVVLMMQAPRFSTHREKVRQCLAQSLNISPTRVGVRATTTDHLGFVGRGEGAAAQATCLAIRGYQ